MAVIRENFNIMALPLAIERANPIPLDKTSIWYNRDEMVAYAASGATAYVGQILGLVDQTQNTATAFIIINEAGDLQEVGAATLGDNQSIVLSEDGVLALKDFGKAFYRYIAATETEPAHYERTEVSAEHPWKAGLEPKVTSIDGSLVLGWYEPNPTTIEGLNTQVTTTQEAVDALEQDVSDIQNVLNDTVGPGGETVDGLITRVTDLEDTTYTKTEVDNLIANVFQFKGTVDAYGDLPLLDNRSGDVYQVGEKEYAWNGEEWVELGYMVDLTNYALKTDITTALIPVNTAIGNLQTSNAELSNSIDDINDLLGTPSENFTSELFPAVEALQTRIDGLVAVGGEANVINGITINGTALTPDANTKIVALPSFEGTTAGLVPVVGNNVIAEGLTANDYVLSAAGTWVKNADSRIGNLTIEGIAYDTVEEYVGAAFDAALVWQQI